MHIDMGTLAGKIYCITESGALLHGEGNRFCSRTAGGMHR